MTIDFASVKLLLISICNLFHSYINIIIAKISVEHSRLKVLEIEMYFYLNSSLCIIIIELVVVKI